jgi:uncharacterized protein (TIGR01244 family)
MKTLSIFFVCSLISFYAIGQKPNLADSVTKLEDFKALYVSGDFFFAGQPTLEAFKYLTEQGVKKVINLRSEKENETFTKDAFNEEKLVKKLGMDYISIPIAGRKDYTPESLKKFAKALSSYDGKVLIHCAGAGRVSYFMMAWLIEYHDYSADKAMAFGKQITFFNYLEALVGKKTHTHFTE